MAIEIVSFPIQNGDFSEQNVSLPEGIWALAVRYPHIVGEILIVIIAVDMNKIPYKLACFNG